MALSPDGRWVYVTAETSNTNGHGNSISVIDAAKRKIVKTVPVGKRPWGLALTPDGRKLYTANGLSRR